MGLKLNPLTGNFDLVGTGGGGGGSYTPANPSDWNPTPSSTSEALDQLAEHTYLNTYHVYRYTLQASDITNKNMTIDNTPLTDTKTRLIVIGGPGDQDYGIDFTVSGNTLSWDSLALDGILETNDKVIVIYN